MDEDVVAFGADGFANADLARALGDGDEHDIHHADAADDEADRGYREHQDEDQAADFLPEFEEIVGREDGEVVGLVVGEAAFTAEEFANFVDGLRNVVGVSGFGEDNVVFFVWIELAERGDGHVGGVVFGIGAAGDALALLLESADDGEKLAVNRDFLADGGSGRAGEECAHGVVAEEDDGSAMVGVGFVEEAALLDFQVEDFADGGLVTLQDYVFRAVRAVAHVGGTGAEFRLENAHGGGRGFDVREPADFDGPFGLEFLAREPVAGRAGERSPGEAVGDDGVGAEFANAAENVVVEAVDDGGDGNDRGDADDDAENGESGAQGIFAESVEREKEFVPEFESGLTAGKPTHGEDGGLRLRECFT